MRVFFFFKQKTAYDMRISDWSSDVCSSDLAGQFLRLRHLAQQDIGPAVARIGRKRAFKPVDRALIILRRKRRLAGAGERRSEESRVGKAGVCTCSTRLSPYH